MASLITLAILIRGTTTASQIGMALNIVLVANTTLLSLVTLWTNLEISLGDISRLKNLEANTPTEHEPHENNMAVDNSWPSSGLVEFDNVTVEYNPDAVALRNINLKVVAGQQSIICGCTGRSGKSTLLLALLRLLDVKSRAIKVDGIDISLVPRSLVRQRCFITVIQDPFVLAHRPVFGSTLIAMTSLPQLSTGQTQIFTLAQAILSLEGLKTATGISEAHQRGCANANAMLILLLDEATSSLDPGTEAVIGGIMRREFVEKGHTTIAITHRVSETLQVGGRGMIVQLDGGRIERVDDTA
ncbi:hypothetical protein UA08_00082 [Talaromyces atroroseus]|uniref:ABC transporter domain-containing protein n=1 Tax=Talaromyces atroroseus TaxID=1441469 RepID=A0A225ARB4_TALAT|nr:hypothetical protein UA08_00082 [Talaromyces atroroseus]OKL64131.1 hypothetical protein UA08_00082 [Talaromyces atroroseus]